MRINQADVRKDAKITVKEAAPGKYLKQPYYDLFNVHFVSLFRRIKKAFQNIRESTSTPRQEAWPGNWRRKKRILLS